ncbi:peptidoglycan D,D-transpeptidase FtsI family protein [Schlesneria paludicola]|uniref:peptidoglycan D,D-transpeptidase FtsI family protein n=1 Tax=Schlesneria paludicola TaxID=360056 RepID=UPI00029AE8B0|nr:penicillin-binding protein 2 [Schlesneria paludicola]
MSEASTTSVQVPQWRPRLVVTILGIGWLVLAGRLVQLQWVQQGQFADKAEQQRELVEEIPARPGDIVDRQGRLLATTLSARSLYLVPSRIKAPAEIAESLASVLQISRESLLERLCQNAHRHFLWIKRRLTDEEVSQVRRLNLPKSTWGFRDEYRREYPQGVVAAHVLGLRDIDGVGRGGIEENFDRELRGQPGQRRVARDSRGHVIEILDEELRPAHPGREVRLSLDVVVQLYAERELDSVMQEWKPESCCAVVIDPAKGEILAMATRPTFDPNEPQDASPDSWKNRVIADIYEPGSTFKPMIVSYGLDRGFLEKDDTYNCENGQYRMGRRLLHDHHRYGLLSLTDVLVKSSNIGMAKIGERMENPALHEAATIFGFGHKTGIELPGELPGILRPLKDWTSYSTGSIPMGHELATTPLQLITAHAALANGGQLIRPRIVLPDPNESDVTMRGMTESIVSSETAQWIVAHPMQEVVTRGTGKKAKIPGYHVFGKTGTAQCISPEGGYVHGKYISSFVCGAPVESPRLLTLVVVNQSSVGGETFGGRVAAPAAANILRQALTYLRVAPDEQLLRTAKNPKN